MNAISTTPSLKEFVSIPNNLCEFPEASFEIHTRNGPLSRFDYCRADGRRIHLWEAELYLPEESVPWEGDPDFEHALRFELFGKCPVHVSRFLALLPLSEDKREMFSMKILFAKGLEKCALELMSEAGKLSIMAEPYSFTPVGSLLIQAQYLWEALGGMGKDVILKVGRYPDERDVKPLVMSSGPAAAIIANLHLS